MKLQPDKNIDSSVISGYGAGYVDVNGARHTSSLMLLPNTDPNQQLVAWPVSDIKALEASDFQAVVQAAVELVIIGTGTRQRFIKPQVLQALYGARIGVEMMDTRAACRTYNILAGEGRRVAAALLIDDGS